MSADEKGAAEQAAPHFDEAAVRAALEAETVAQIKERIDEANEYRETQKLPSLIRSGPKARLIDALVASYQEAGLDTETALEPPDGSELADEHGAEDPPEATPRAESDPDEPDGEPQPSAALVPLGPPESAMPSRQEYASMLEIAERICRTEFVPRDFRNRPDAVLASIMTGRELGIGPMQALKDISIIDGRPALSASLMMALMRKGGVVVLESECTSQLARITARRSDTGETMTVEWTYADAEKIRQKGKALTAKDNWVNYPADMLWARCVGRLARRLAPDILGGMGYSAEEVADFDFGESSAPPQQVRRDAAWSPPGDWKELNARLVLALGGVEPSEAEAREWVRQAVRAKWSEDGVRDLDEAQKREAWTMLQDALKHLESLGDLAFDPDARAKIAKAFAAFGPLEGPVWRISPGDEEARPSYWQHHGLPDPEKPTATPVIEDGEWTEYAPVVDTGPRTAEDQAERQAAWDAYVAAERVAHPTWVYPDDVPDDWEIGEQHIPF